MHRIRLDPALPLRSQPERGHNRWNSEIEPVLTVQDGDEVELELRDAMDGQITPDSRDEDLLTMEPISHVLTGPVEIEDAEPGNVLDVEILGYETAAFGWTGVVPGSGIVGDLVERPLLVKWELRDGVARSEQLPGVSVRASTHAGVMGVAPSRELFEAALARETALHDEGHAIRMPDPSTAFPIDGLRTMPPRENGGNMDIRDLVAGARLLLPVHVPGALFSAGDLHFVQGDGEVSLYAIECAGAIRVRFKLRRDPQWLPRFPAYEAPPRPERRVFATTGIPLRADGSNAYLDAQLAARRAIEELVGWLRSACGMPTEHAIALCSVAGELRMSQVVDYPNALVSAALPLDVFE